MSAIRSLQLIAEDCTRQSGLLRDCRDRLPAQGEVMDQSRFDYRGSARLLIPATHDDKLCISCPAHSVDGSRYAGPCGVLVTAFLLRHGRNRTIGTTDNGSTLIKRRRRPEVHNETCVLGCALPGDSCAGLYAER